MRIFFLIYRERIGITSNEKSETLSRKLKDPLHNAKSETLSRIFKTVVEFTLPEGQDQIFSREYKLYLPDKEELKKQLESTFK